MVNKSTIVRNLAELDRRYKKNSRNPRDPLYYSKLSIIELCGWIEGTMDAIVRNCAVKHLNEAKNRNHIEDRVIERNNSFTYDDFREMMAQVIGLAKVEQIERTLDATNFEIMKSSLGSLKKERNRVAHTHLSNVTQTISAPSAIRRHFLNVYAGLKEFEQRARRLTM